MNATTRTECTCKSCSGAQCTCGCQNPAWPQSLPKPACACGPNCQCGPQCGCAGK